jgi:hypothetical protein
MSTSSKSPPGPHREHWGLSGTDATAPYDRRDDFVRKRIPDADSVDLAAYFDRWPGQANPAARRRRARHARAI